MALLMSGFRLGFALLLLCALYLGAAPSARAGTLSCGADFGGVIDGFDAATLNTILSDNNLTLAIDSSCVIKNWPEDNGLGGFPATNINFYFPGGADYYIAFEDVYYPGNMSCNSPQNSNFWIYWAPGSFNSINASCQDFMVPVDALKKFNPPSQTTASIGIPFTYTITMPYMGQLDVDSGTFFYTDDYDSDPISNIVITDDLTEGNTAALSYDGTAAAYSVDSGGNRTLLGSLVTGVSQAWLDAHPVSETEPRLSDNTKHLVFSYENNPILVTGVPAGEHLEIDLQVVLDGDLIANFPGNTFTNTAAFWFDKTIITYNDDGTIKSTTPMTDLYGWPFTTPSMTVAEPILVVDKTSSETNLNVGDPAPYTIDVENVGGGTAWNVEITDLLPSRQDEPGPDSGGMCPITAPAVTAQILAADLTLITDLTQGTHYTVSYDQPNCELTLTLLDAPAAKIGPNQHLRIYYDLQLDVGTSEGLTFTNVAGATSWFNSDSSIATRYQYVKNLTDGTPGTPDFQDAYSITSATHGYFFLKAVDDLATGESPAASAFPGDTLRYTLQIQNFTLPTLSNITITDDLGALNPAGTIVSGSLTPVSDDLPVGVSLVYDSTGGTNGAGLITLNGLTLNDGDHYQIQFDVTLDPNLSDGAQVSNQALISGIYPTGTYADAPSDDPNDGGGPKQLMDPTEPGYSPPDVTDVTIQAPDALAKANPAITTATIGNQFTYQITVPATTTDIPLYDVQILDDLSRLVSGADLQFVSATAHLASGTQSWTLVNSGIDDINLILEEANTGIDIPSGDQAIIEVTVQLLNTLDNDAGDSFTNSASYTYNKINGGGSTTRLDGGAGNTPTPISVVEPVLTATKAVANVTAGKLTSDPAAAGDTLKYTVTVTNNGGPYAADAFDTSIVDVLPGNVTYVLGTATATIGGSLVSGFVVDPYELPPGTFTWGSRNGDDNLDILVGQSLVLTYQVNVLAVDGTPITNIVYVDWTSLNGAMAGERDGNGCPTITAPDDYCEVPTPATIATTDPTTIVKSVVSDSWDTGLSTSNDSMLRVGDTVVYRLALTLHEGVTQSVTATDTLPAGLAFDGVVSVNGDTTAPYSAAGAFSYADIPGANVPAPGQTGAITWTLGDISNAIDNDPTNDTFVIEYRAIVVKDTIAQASSASLANSVALSYTGSDPASPNLQSGATIEVRQPVMTTPTKTAAGFTSPANVDIVSDVMPFQLESCNNGSAPAYSAEFTDVLASQMDETSISVPVVTVGGTTLTAGTDYDYSYTAADRTMTFLLDTPINPAECVTIDYTIGFHTDVGPNQTWDNSVTLDEYWSLTTPTTTGQMYGPLSSVPFVMTNPLTVEPLAKSVGSPAGGEVTIGEGAVYLITVPGMPVNAALSDVVVTDTLDSALEYEVGGSTAVDDLGNPVTLTDTSAAPGNVSLTITQIPAGRQVIITLPVRVANNATANAGLSFTNTASYTYTGIPAGSVTDGTSGPLIIVEPLVTVVKNVAPVTPPTAGDYLTYTVDLTAVLGANYSGAFDTGLVDTLSLGLLYVPGTATVGGNPVEPNLNGADGITTQQTLTWADIDIPEGTTVTVVYQVQVLDSVGAGQTLTNNVTARWTSLDGPSTHERDGSGSPAENDYFATATTSLTTPDNTTLAKTRLSDTYNAADANLRVGDLVDYELRLGLQEGTHTGLVLTDTLPTGLTFVGMVRADFFGTPGTATPTVAGQTITWNLGTVVNTADSDPTNDFLVIVYRARVLNGGVLPQVNSIPLANNATLDYTIGGVPATQLTAGQTVTVLQPHLTMSKSAAPAGGDTVIDANEFITYTIDVINDGVAPAYDPVVQDILPAGLRLGGVNTTNITLEPAGTILPVIPPAYVAATGTATWNLDSGGADTYTIPAGQTLRIEYTVQADAALGPGLTLTNAASATLYYSFDDEAVPANGNVADRAVYGPSNTATSALTTPLPGGPLKKNPVDPNVTIGQEFTYTVTVPATPQPTALHDVKIYDDLVPISADVTLVSITDSGSHAWTPVNTGTPTSLIIEDAAGGSGIEIPANGQITIEITLRVDNTTGNNAGLNFNNSASYTYNQVDGDDGTVLNGGSSATTNMTVIEPALTVAKAVTLISPAPITGGSVLEYTVTVVNTGNATAYDVNLVDTLPPELALYSGFLPDATIDSSPVALFAANPSGAPAGPLVWGRNNGGDGSLDIPPAGGTLVLTYQVQVQISTAATFTNQVWVDWTSLNDVSTYERTGAGCPTITAPNDYCAGPATATTSTTDNNSLAKTVVSDSYVDGSSSNIDATVRIGDIATYDLILNLGEGTTDNVQVSDVLPTGMAFDSLVSITPTSGSGSFSYSVAAQPAPGDTGTLVWNLGTVVNVADGDPTNDFLTIEYTARVLNNSLTQQPSITLTNTATLSYTDGSGTPVVDPARLVASADLTVWQPDLTVSKNAAPAGGDTVIEAGEIITYMVDVVNSGTAPAYDPVVQDILPVGLRQGGVTTSSISLEPAGTILPAIPPAYVQATGTATWNLDSGGADTYTIPAGQTLRIVYTVQADAGLGPGQTLTNAATATLYYSFDDEAIPGGGMVSQREVYGPSNTSTTTLTTPAAVALSKGLQDPAQTTASIGVPFTYRITIPATPQTTALNDVRITDDLTLLPSAPPLADLSFVNATVVSGGTWTLSNTGDAKHLVIEDTTNGIDIPAGGQAVIDITVVLDNTAANVAGLDFNNAANYTYNAVNNDNTSQANGFPGTSPNLTIAEPDTVILNKTGPVTMRRGLPGPFIIDVQNTGTAAAWDMTITDVLPDPTPGGMCDNAPTNVTAQIFEADGTTPVSGVLTQGADYVVGFSGVSVCTLTITMQSTAASIGPTERLIVTYDAVLDDDSIGGTSLTNIAAATEWFSGDTAGTGAPGSIRTYAGTLSNGTVGTDDEQDAHSLTTESPVLVFQKSVVNVTPPPSGSNAQPGDRLQYTIHVENISPVALPDYALVDELDALNPSALFMPGSLTIVSVPGSAVDNSNPNGGAKGTGLLDISSLRLEAAGGADSVDIVFEATLIPVINSGTVVLNQARMSSYGVVLGVSDDPNVNGADDPNVSGDEDPTRTLINSAPAFEIWKTSQDLTGDPAVLMAGDTLRYTITVKNIGNENAVNVMLRDQIPANTTYMANSTTLNGNAVADPAAGVSPMQDGLLINAPEDTAPGAMRADATATTTNVATITFEVTVNSNTLDGTVISNQAFANGNGAGSGPFPEHPSDDPATSTVDDPTLDVVGSLPLVDAQKTVQLLTDSNSNGLVDPDDVLQYTITINNLGAVPATGVVFTDAVPADTTYEADTTFLNGDMVTDLAGGISPLVAGIPISSSDLTPPLPTVGNGILSPDASAVITFNVRVNLGVLPDTVISNQGVVATNELPDEPTDADGIDANGDQPTQVIVGPSQLLSITKEVFVVGGGTAEPGAQLEYQIRVTNIGSTTATNVVVTDDFSDPDMQVVTYVVGSGLMNGSTDGVSYAGMLLTADYATRYGDLQPGAIVSVRFRAQIDSAVAIGTTIINTGTVSWNAGSQNDQASVSLDVGGTPGSAGLNGRVWHDAYLNTLFDGSEQPLAGWSVELYRNNVLLATTLTDASGTYYFGGVVPNQGLPDPYELRFRAPGAGPNTASLGYADSPVIYGCINGPQRISGIFIAPSGNLQGLNLPIWPNGVVFNSVTRDPVAGATLTMIHNGGAVAASCFDDPAQQNQVTSQRGFYKFDLNFSDLSCPSGGDYVIRVTPPAGGYMTGPSRVIPPVPGYTDPAFDPGATPYQVPLCPDDAVAMPAGFCEAQPDGSAPIDTVPPTSIKHYLYLTLYNTAVPGDSQIFNNHIPVDPELTGSVSITKTTSMLNVTRGQLVPYTITVTNVLGSPLYNIGIIDRFPAGFKYVQGSARLDGVPSEPDPGNGRELLWPGLTLQVNAKHTIQLLLVVGAGVTEAEYVNRAQAINLDTGEHASGEATATVRVIPDPIFDCTDVIGKVFDDQNLNGYQDHGEQGLAGVRLATARGLIGTTDKHGRFHITCAVVPDENRGSNFILKLDDRSLPTGYRLTTENPRVQRATRGKMLRFNFGATIHRVVHMDIADGVFEPDSTEMRLQWQPRIARLLEELRKAPAVLRLSYLADVESEGLVEQRLKALKKLIAGRWDGGYRLTIETEVFWRRGSPP